MLLTYDMKELRDPTRALDYASRSCKIEEAAGGRNLGMYLDTLALAQYQTGDTTTAIATQKRAISLPSRTSDPAAAMHMSKQLAEFEAALTVSPDENVDATTADDSKGGESDKSSPVEKESSGKK